MNRGSFCDSFGSRPFISLPATRREFVPLVSRIHPSVLAGFMRRALVKNCLIDSDLRTGGRLCPDKGDAAPIGRSMDLHLWSHFPRFPTHYSKDTPFWIRFIEFKALAFPNSLGSGLSPFSLRPDLGICNSVSPFCINCFCGRSAWRLRRIGPPKTGFHRSHSCATG